MKDIYDELTQLGKNSNIPKTPEAALIERVRNPHKSENYVIRFTCPEFTSLCPITGQPDFAFLLIDYIPNDYIIESKSLKLYLNSFRNEGAFHEDCTIKIAKRIFDEIEPKWLRMGGYWYPRGGIPIDIFFTKGSLPEGTWVPEQKIDIYRGR